MRKTGIVLFLAGAATLCGQSMIANIEQPVTGEFGVYTPYAVTITADAELCDPGPQLGKVVNLSSYSLSPAALALLQQNHFVVAPATQPPNEGAPSQYNELFDVYCACREKGIPIFVTSDALLHSFHLCFDYILKTCEEKRFIQQLNGLLSEMLLETQHQIEAAGVESVKQAAMTNFQYLIVAKRLLDSTYVEPINGGAYLQELDLIGAAEGFYQSPLFHYNEDYSQYIVRGHYTRSTALRRYFQSMMWLGRMTFSCENAALPASRAATRSALLLVQAFQKSTVNTLPALRVWNDIYQPTAFFVGRSDDLGFPQYLPLIDKVYGLDFATKGPDVFADEDKLTAFFVETAALPTAAIGYPKQPVKGFRFMGRRFIPDSWILDELVFDKLPNRFMPTGLDVMQVLGSARASRHLSATDKNNPYYLAKIEELKGIFAAYPAETWAQNLYWNWLYTLMPLLAEKGPGYPTFMQTLAWQDKDLYAALASWAELRHDTILYAKSSGGASSEPPSALGTQGYVEANPHFFARIAALAEYLKTGLENRDLLFEEFSFSLNRLTELGLRLKMIAEKELTRTALTADDYKVIFNIGPTLYDIVTFGHSHLRGPAGQQGLEPMPVIADVHTDANSGLVLEEGVGYPYAIYVVCMIEGQPVLTKGAGYSYHEFTWPMNDRLTDEKWRDMLTDYTNFKLPQWITSFAADIPSAGGTAGFYAWQKPSSAFYDVILSPESPKQGQPLNLQIRLNSIFYPPLQPSFKLYAADGSIRNIALQQSANYPVTWTGDIDSQGLPAGATVLEIETRMDSQTILNRTSFYLTASTKVNDQMAMPVAFQVRQNQPNPFNSTTVIVFDLPAPESVVCEIFSIHGRRVRALLPGTLERGTHRVLWDGRDENGQSVASGIYTYRLRAGERMQSGRMALVR